MRRWVLLIVFLCLSAGAFALAQVFHFRLPVDEVFEAHKSAPEAAAPASVANAPAAGSKAEADTGSSASQHAGNEPDGKEKNKSSEGSAGDGVKLDLAGGLDVGCDFGFRGACRSG
ncbi:hypothetical protein [Bradyrhizobium sp. RDI18]|uniref:hypothetical protein n=1 Tax=Bradyrhizobium sp. RDI18 TaxID=3367400 RepID=UPI003721143E